MNADVVQTDPQMTPQRFNILLIDDNAEAAKLFELALREAAPRARLYWVATAGEGVEARKDRSLR